MDESATRNRNQLNKNEIIKKNKTKMLNSAQPANNI